MNLGTSMADLDAAFAAYEQASTVYAQARETEAQIEDERPLVKHDAMLRLLQLENPLTKKPHSASSAEAAVEQDAEYSGYLAARRAAVRTRILAETKRHVAYMRANHLSGVAA